MKNMTLKTSFVMATMGLVMFGAVGCSDEAVERIENATNALTGEPEKTPGVVKAQQRIERIRQDKKWTLENQAKYPKEYCQAQLAELSAYEGKLNEQAHKYAVTKSQITRLVTDEEARLKSFEQFLQDSKTAYRLAEQNNQWPMTVNGQTLSKEKGKAHIIDAAQKIQTLRLSLTQRRGMLAVVEQKGNRVELEQRKIVKIRERIQMTLTDLELKAVIDADNGISDALNAINDSLNSLGTNYAEPSIDDLLIPQSKVAEEKLFDEIMAE